MNCYIGLAKRIAKSCFPPVIPVPQLEPLDARLIIKHRSYQAACEEASKYPCERWKEVYDEHMNVSFNPKPISDEEAWEAALVWAEAKAQEREVLATKEESQTDTDESYDSDDIEVGVSIHPMKREVSLFGDDSDDDDDEAIRDMIMRFEEDERIAKKRITREKEKEKSLLKAMLESQSLSDDDTDNE